MKSIQALTDKTAIGLSLLCTLHCLVLPLAITLIPSFSSLLINNEAFHLWLLVAVIPTSIYALFMGCKQHRRYKLIVWGAAGLSCLIAAVIIGEALGEAWEKTLTVLGAAILAYTHFLNYRQCQKQTNCCHNPANNNA